MQLSLYSASANEYKNRSQKIRVITEDWVGNQIYCTSCGSDISHFKNNNPAADFYCDKCNEEYELKSKKGLIGKKIVDGAYKTTIEKLLSDSNPSLFLLNYNYDFLKVSDFLVIPKHFFMPDIIEKRKPLSSNARRAGWIGCNILIHQIPFSGRIYYIKDGKIEPKDKVMEAWEKTIFLRKEREISARGWLLDVMNCVEMIGKEEFNLGDIYKFEKVLSKKHPGNFHICDKIRQQLQILRDNKLIKFVARGKYKVSK